jgi:hypothetical protein
MHQEDGESCTLGVLFFFLSFLRICLSTSGEDVLD